MAQLHSRDEARRRRLVCPSKSVKLLGRITNVLNNDNESESKDHRWVPNLAFLNSLLDLFDFDFAEAFDLQEGFTRRGMDGLEWCRKARLAICTRCQFPRMMSLEGKVGQGVVLQPCRNRCF